MSAVFLSQCCRDFDTPLFEVYQDIFQKNLLVFLIYSVPASERRTPTSAHVRNLIMTTTATKTEARGSRLFESHPSLSVSLEDFEQHEKPSPKVIRFPSHHSGFHEESSEAGTDSDQPPYSPAFFRPTMSSQTSGWYRHQPYEGSSPLRLSPEARLNSRERSYLRASATFDDDDPTLPLNIPLPQGSMSPTKSYFTPSPSPEHRFTSPPTMPQASVPAPAAPTSNDGTSGPKPNCEPSASEIHAG